MADTCDCGALPVGDNYGYLTGDGWMHTAGDGCGPDIERSIYIVVGEQP